MMNQYVNIWLYMLHYLSMMMTVSDIFLLLDGTPEAYTKKKELWQYLKDHVSPKVYRSVVLSLGGVTNVSVPGGDKVVLGCYRLARKLFKFNSGEALRCLLLPRCRGSFFAVRLDFS